MSRAKIGEPDRWLNAHINHDGDECLRWPFGKPKTYGSIVINGKSRGAHRVMCQRAHGEEPFESAHVAHSCANKWCVNPKHLRWATHDENMRDKVLHGSTNPGEANYKAILSNDDVLRIIASDESNVALGKRLGVAPTTVSNIRTGKSWRHLTGIRKPKRQLKVTAEQAEAIRNDPRRGVDLAREYGVSQQLICDIKHNRR